MSPFVALISSRTTDRLLGSQSRRPRHFGDNLIEGIPVAGLLHANRGDSPITVFYSRPIVSTLWGSASLSDFLMTPSMA